MVNKSDFDNNIKQELVQKASEAQPSDEMLPRIINRIQDYERGRENMLRDKISYISMRKLVTVSLCAILVLGGVMFTFSDEVRAATLDVIKTIFVLDKTEDGYAIVEKSTEEPILQPSCSKTSELNDDELSEKMGFRIRYPKALDGDYSLVDRAESVMLRTMVSDETRKQLEPEMFKAINDEAAFQGLSDYKPFRNAFATYESSEGNMLFISVQLDADYPLDREINKAEETNIGDINAAWYEETYPNYDYINDNGIGRSDIYSKPDGLVKKHFLTWEFNGVRYMLHTYKDFELTKEDAVKIAESFMAQQ